ncbi:hypothetical protein QN416_24410, partial [Glaciimonas sp. Cout2]
MGDGGEGSVEVGDQVGLVLDTDGEADDVVCDLEFRSTHRGVRNLGGVVHEGLDATEGLGELEELRGLGEGAG